jgi:alpha-glucosidase
MCAVRPGPVSFSRPKKEKKNMAVLRKNLIGSVMFIFILAIIYPVTLFAREYQLQSPDKRMTVKLTAADKIYYSVFYDSKPIVKPSPISLTLHPGTVLGRNPKVKNTRFRTVDKKISPVVRQKNAVIIDRYNELIIFFKGDFSLIFRAYDDGAAYRFTLNKKGKVKVLNEEVKITFADNHHIYFPAEKSFFSHQERLYEYIPVTSISKNKFSSLPMLVDIKEEPKVAIAEADLEDYPGMYMRGNNNTMLTGIFPGFPLKEETVDLSKRGGDRSIRVLECADYIALIGGKRNLPWRVLVIADDDADLVTSEIIFKLAKPLQIKDTSWIKPGKVAWDWWNFNNIYGVDFEAGINTETYKYYIDFAAKYGIEYVILDEGWYELGDLLKINPGIDMEEILAYAKNKNVGIILWVVWKTLEDQLHEAMGKFATWGVKGIKVDFMQRDDQKMVNFYERIAREAEKRKMVVDFHGSYTPRGLRRAYPNVITREGVRGLEHYKWESGLSPEHEVTLPFIRMLAGPMDFTPGAMINAQKENFKPVFRKPMSQGTRCHQLAMYVVYESPLQMLADNPTHYLREKECMDFLAKVPTVWDETRVLQAKVADYIAVARRKGVEWYLGAMTDWTPRELELRFDFLDKGTYTAEIYQDGVNAHRNGNDYTRLVKTIEKGQSLKIRLAPGGGWAATLYKK